MGIASGEEVGCRLCASSYWSFHPPYSTLYPLPLSETANRENQEVPNVVCEEIRFVFFLSFGTFSNDHPYPQDKHISVTSCQHSHNACTARNWPGRLTNRLSIFTAHDLANEQSVFQSTVESRCGKHDHTN